MDKLDEEEYGFSRNYFLAKEKINKKTTTSNKVSDINLIDESELRAAIANIKPKHESEVRALIDSYKCRYSKWVFNLRCGFGLLMYGFGSKKALLEDFASTALSDYTVLVINGYLPSVNLKQVLVTLAELLWEQMKMQRTLGSSSKTQQPFSSHSLDDLLSFIDRSGVEEDDDKDCFICVVVHNIDGTALRDAETQQCLARLAACSRIRIVASIDHVNAPLLWDKKMVHSQFNWYWCHVPTYEAYTIEGRFSPLILAHGNTTQSAKTAAIVLQSLTSNAQSVFRVLAEHQLSHPDEEGMPIQDLYNECREHFLVNSQVVLNSHLTEFKDHELVKTRRNSDGQDCLYIPLNNEALEKLLAEINQ